MTYSVKIWYANATTRTVRVSASSISEAETVVKQTFNGTGGEHIFAVLAVRVG